MTLGKAASRRHVLGWGIGGLSVSTLLATTATAPAQALGIIGNQLMTRRGEEGDSGSYVHLANFNPGHLDPSLTLPPARRTRNVSSTSQLHAALRDAQPGDHVVLSSGSYTGPGTFSRAGTQSAPVVVRSSSPLGARITGGSFLLAGNYQILHGLDFVRTTCEVSNGATAARIWRCRFRDRPPSAPTIALRLRASSYADIAHCEFVNWAGRGVASGTNAGARNPIIRRCLFKNSPRGFAQNGTEAIIIGFAVGDAQRDAYALIDSCRVANWNSDDEAISVKSSRVTVRRCILENCNGNINNRLGRYNLFDACWIKNSHGIGVFDGNNQVLGCRVDNSGRVAIFNSIVLNGGTTRAGVYPSNISGGDLRPAAENTVVAGCSTHNDIALVVGYMRSSNPRYTQPVRNTLVRQHSGRVTVTGGSVNGDIQPSQGASGVRWSSLVWLNDSDVGPGARGLSGTPATASTQSESPSSTSQQSQQTASNSPPQQQSATSAPTRGLNSCSGDPQAILRQYTGRNPWEVSKMYRDYAHQNYLEARKHPVDSSAYNQYRAAYRACDKVHFLADALGKAGRNRI